jgi:anti-anti-sigma factor
MPTTQFRRSSRVAAQPAAPFRCWRSRAKTATIVTVTGELDIATVPDLDTQLRAAERETPLVVLDLRALEFVDSSGAALMLATDRRVSHAGGRFVVVRGRSRSSGYSR